MAIIIWLKPAIPEIEASIMDEISRFKTSTHPRTPIMITDSQRPML